MKYADLPHVSIMDLLAARRQDLLRRQFPPRARKKLKIMVVRWNDALWAEIQLFKGDPADMWWGSRRDEFELLGACELLRKPRRYKNRLVAYATLDPALIAYSLVRL